jgi:hypothetical protein
MEDGSDDFVKVSFVMKVFSGSDNWHILAFEKFYVAGKFKIVFYFRILLNPVHGN